MQIRFCNVSFSQLGMNDTSSNVETGSIENREECIMCSG